MLIKCWGTRGGVPVSGEKYIKYGGDTTCFEIITSDEERVIIDSGTGIRRLGIELIEGDCKNINILFTHSHWDHIIGFPFFKPIYSDNANINIFGGSPVQESIREAIEKAMTPPNFPVKLEDIQCELNFNEASGEPFEINSLDITPIAISHPNRGFGYKFHKENLSFVFLTDNELAYKHEGGESFKTYRDFCQGADLLLHDAEFIQEEYEKTKSWGHSTVSDVMKLGMEAEVDRLGFIHHNQERTDGELDRIVKRCRKRIEKKDLDMDCFAVGQGSEIGL